MKINNLEMFCVTNKIIPHIEKTSYKIAGVGKNHFPNDYLNCDSKDNIFYKEEYYSELAFHYWYWKNLIKLNDNGWVGFCQKRRFWIKSSSIKKKIDISNLNEHLLYQPEADWSEFESIISHPIDVSGVKKIKILKRGWRSVIRNPLILFNERYQNLKLHFDMHHGYGNLDLAINLLDDEDRDDFITYVNTNTKFNPHIMFITKPKIANKWFRKLFVWLERCEKKIGFKNLSGYDTKRLYAYLAERYLSFWFKKYTVYKEHPWIFIEN